MLLFVHDKVRSMDSSKANSDDDDDDDRKWKSFFKLAHIWVIDSSNINLEECVLKSVQNVFVAKLLKEESFFSLQKNVKCKFFDKKQKKSYRKQKFDLFWTQSSLPNFPKRFCTILCGTLLKPCKLTLRADTTNSYKFSPDLGAVHKSRRQNCRSEVYTFLPVGWSTFSSELSWTPKTHPNDSRAAAWTKQQQSCYLVVFFEFNSAFGRYRYWLVAIAKPSFSSWMILK